MAKRRKSTARGKAARKPAARTTKAPPTDGRANRKGPVEVKEVRRQIAALETLIGRIEATAAAATKCGIDPVEMDGRGQLDRGVELISKFAVSYASWLAREQATREFSP